MVTDYFVAHTTSLAQAKQQAIDWTNQQVQNRASFPGYMNALWVLLLISLAAVPLALSLRKVKLGGAVREREWPTRHGSRCDRGDGLCRWRVPHRRVTRAAAALGGLPAVASSDMIPIMRSFAFTARWWWPV